MRVTLDVLLRSGKLYLVDFSYLYIIININNIMKHLSLTIAIFSLLLAPVIAGVGTSTHKNHTYSCGCCSYVQKVFVRYNHCGRPIYTNRYIPVRHTCSSGSRPSYTHHQQYRYSHSSGNIHYPHYYNRSKYHHNHHSAHLRLHFGGCNSGFSLRY